MSFAATQKTTETIATNEAELWFASNAAQEAVQASDKCDLCGEPLTQGERFTHKACSDYENFLASL